MSSQRHPSSGDPPKAACKRLSHPRQQLARSGEDHAARHLERLGFQLVERNVRTRFGEIDLIVFDGRSLVFAEVKTRATGHRSTALPRPLERLRPRQCARLRRLASAWLADPKIARPRAETIRFDAIGVVLDRTGELLSLEHLEAAW